MLDRRSVIKGIAGVPLAAILADPILARAAAATLQTVATKTAGGKNVSAAIAYPDETPAPAVILVHEWWGLNDQIKTMAAEFANLGYIGLAVDLYGGGVATTRDGARALMKAVDSGEATQTLTAWGDWLNRNKAAKEKRATIGWCFGGGWSLNASIAMPVDATIVYYGRVNRAAADLAKLKGPVLGHFASRDKWINRDMVGGFEKEMDQAGKTYTSHWYEADHAFANPTSARYDEADAKLAWERTRKFLAANL